MAFTELFQLTSIGDFPDWEIVIRKYLGGNSVASPHRYLPFDTSLSGKRRQFILRWVENKSPFSGMGRSEEILDALRLSYEQCVFEGRFKYGGRVLAYQQIGQYQCCSNCLALQDALKEISWFYEYHILVKDIRTLAGYQNSPTGAMVVVKPPKRQVGTRCYVYIVGGKFTKMGNNIYLYI
jgi:hypothetical protein